MRVIGREAAFQSGCAAGGGFYLAFGAFALFLASVPYLWGYLITPPGHVYSGFFVHNIDDTGVYFAWMRQAEAGQFFLRNQFTTEEQRGVLFNLLFWLLGTLARLTRLPMILVYHLARVVFGALLLWAVATLLHATLASRRARRTAFALVCVASGFGWIANGYQPERGLQQPIDLWQPEAITFLSLYGSPLFCAALGLMVVFVTSALRAERAGSVRAFWPGALAALLLGNFHSYDVIHLLLVYGAFRVGSDVAARRVSVRGWQIFLLAVLWALPTTAYQYWALQVETVFRARALQTFTRSPAPWWVLLGLGLPALLAVSTFAWPQWLAKNKPSKRADPLAAGFTDDPARRLLLTWAVVGFAAAYLPFPFQRKLLMGIHVPLCALAGLALTHWTAQLPQNLPRIVLAGTILLTTPTNLWFVVRDLHQLSTNTSATSHRPYLTRNEADALQWLRQHTGPRDAVLVGPDPDSHRRFPFFVLRPHLAVYVPAIAGNVVYNGHWSETARYGDKLAAMLRFFQADTSDALRQALLREANIRYVLYTNALGRFDLRDASGNRVYVPVPWPEQTPPYLRPVYANTEITVYAVQGKRI